MYFNNVHVLIYGVLGIIGLIVGKFCAWYSKRLPEKKKVFSKEYFEENKKGIELSYVFMIITAVIYMLLLFKFGIKGTFFKNLDLLKFLILVPMLELTFFIDLKHRIIPNRLTMTMFEIGIIIMFVYGIANINILKNMLFGMLTGGGIFLTITLLGGLVAGKEAMGLGDVKFMGALGLYLGVSIIAEVSFLAFLLAAIISIGIMIVRKYILKNPDDEIPFGPFLSLSALLCIFLPNNIVFSAFAVFCKGISMVIISCMM